jgi:mono/diheme cytochrome c family protein
MVRIIVVCALIAAACGKGDEPPPPTSGVPGAPPESGPSHRPSAGGTESAAQKMFASVCANCHGIDGTANTEIAKALPVKPRNYTDAAWQASVTDDQIKQIILQGGAALGKSPMMSGHPELADKPEVLDGLVKIIRGFGPKK